MCISPAHEFRGVLEGMRAFSDLDVATLAEIDYFVSDSEPALLIGRPAQQDAMRAIATAHGVRLSSR